ncbi:MAG: ABC transporter permease [Deltaproteobacteria bacterium]|nr:ABC transporter permease [Deltaproteobacteria bacterium]MBI3078246.1 ABC transporter permease [Deltaproteobacteria bacterium]
MLHVAGDPAQLLVPMEASREDVELLRRQLGLDRPLPVRYLIFLGGILTGNFGRSFFSQDPALGLVLDRLPATLELALAGLGLALVVAIPLGSLAALKRGTLWDRGTTALAVGGQAMPAFWLGLMLIIVFSVKLRLLPVSGRDSPAHLVLPAATLASFLLPVLMRLTRSQMIEILGQDYIRTARAKGVGMAALIFRHALRNAWIPIVTVVGLQFGRLLGGTIVTETVFAWPGAANLAVRAIRNLDYPVVQTVVILLAFSIVVVNLLTDLVVARLDPRVRLQ